MKLWDRFQTTPRLLFTPDPTLCSVLSTLFCYLLGFIIRWEADQRAANRTAFSQFIPSLDDFWSCSPNPFLPNLVIISSFSTAACYSWKGIKQLNVARVPCPQLHYRSSMCQVYPLFLNGNSAGGWSEKALHGLISDDARAWVMFQICNLILGINYRISGREHPRRLWREGRGNKLGRMFHVIVTVFEADHQSGFIGPTNWYTIWQFRMNALLFTKR